MSGPDIYAHVPGGIAGSAGASTRIPASSRQYGAGAGVATSSYGNFGKSGAVAATSTAAVTPGGPSSDSMLDDATEAFRRSLAENAPLAAKLKWFKIIGGVALGLSGIGMLGATFGTDVWDDSQSSMYSSAYRWVGGDDPDVPHENQRNELDNTFPDSLLLFLVQLVFALVMVFDGAWTFSKKTYQNLNAGVFYGRYINMFTLFMFSLWSLAMLFGLNEVYVWVAFIFIGGIQLPMFVWLDDHDRRRDQVRQSTRTLIDQETGRRFSPALHAHGAYVIYVITWAFVVAVLYAAFFTTVADNSDSMHNWYYGILVVASVFIITLVTVQGISRDSRKQRKLHNPIVNEFVVYAIMYGWVVVLPWISWATLYTQGNLGQPDQTPN